MGKDLSAHAAEFDADMEEEDFGPDGGRADDADIGGNRNFQAPNAWVEGDSRCSFSSLLTRRGLDAPDIDVEGESCDSLSLTRRGLTAPDAGGADAGADPDETMVLGFGAGACDAPGESCSGVVMSRDMTSQSCRETIIFYTPIPRHGRERV
jgi:hypothetical protein